LFVKSTHYPAKYVFFSLLKHWDQLEKDAKDDKEKEADKEESDKKEETDKKEEVDNNQEEADNKEDKKEIKVEHLDKFWELLSNKFKDQLKKAKEIRQSQVLSYDDLE